MKLDITERDQILAACRMVGRQLDYALDTAMCCEDGEYVQACLKDASFMLAQAREGIGRALASFTKRMG